VERRRTPPIAPSRGLIAPGLSMDETKEKPRIGDVFELSVRTGFGYFQYLGRHPEYGDAIRVVPVVFSHSQRIVSSLFENAYVTFYPVRASAAKGLSRAVGNLPAPKPPSVMRRAGVRLQGRVETWIIEDERGETMVRQLSDSELLLPIAAIWNHEFLVQRITEGWLPTQEGLS
jgi:hypothetical protein